MKRILRRSRAMVTVEFSLFMVERCKKFNNDLLMNLDGGADKKVRPIVEPLSTIGLSYSIH